MKKGSRKNHSAAYKAKVALEAAHGKRTTAHLAQAFSVHPSQITAWKRHLLSNIQELFERGAVAKVNRADERLRDEWYQQIGQLQVELAWLKKSRELSLEDRRAMIDTDALLSMRRQCVLLGLHRSGVYHNPSTKSGENLHLMRRIDNIYTAWPFYGSRRIGEELRREGHHVNRKRTQRLMRLMGLEAIYAESKTSTPARPWAPHLSVSFA